MNLYDLGLEIFSERKFINYKKILPLYLCSVGCHLFNLENKTRVKPIFTSGGLVPDMRLHMFMVTIPGFGKTYTIEQFISKKTGVLDGTEIKTGRIGEMSAAGMVGSIKTNQEGQAVHSQGALQRKKEFILCSDEFSLVTSSGKQQHSKTLNSVFLTALDSGNVTKDLVGGGIDFTTYSTIWGAVQPAIYELGSGMPRRFCFVVYMPDYNDFMKYRDAVDGSDNLTLDLKKLLMFKKMVNERVKEMKEVVKSVEYDVKFGEWLRGFMLPHYEGVLFKRILLGYWVMKLEKLPEKLDLKLTDEVKEIIIQEMAWRLEVQKGVKKIKVWEVIKHIESIAYDNLVKMLLSFSLNYKQVEQEIAILISRKFIEISKDGSIVTNKLYRKKIE